MTKRCLINSLILSSILALSACSALAQESPVRGADGHLIHLRPPLFFKEPWKQPTALGEHPVSQDVVSNANLELKLYGASAKEILISGDSANPGNPLNLWTGITTTPVAATLRDKENYVDLTDLGKMRWVTRTSGFHVVRPVVKLANGTWLVGDAASGTWADFNESEIAVADLRWLALDMTRVVTKGRWVEKPDLSKVDEIGFADLMPASGHGAGGWVNVGQIEVYGKPVKR